MLDVINQLLHGYVSVPVIAACRQAGVFAVLQSEGPLSAEELSARLGANLGPLSAAIRLLKSLQWLSHDTTGRLVLTPRAGAVACIPADSLSLYRMDIAATLAGSPGTGALAGWIERCTDGWAIDDPDVAGLLDGMIIVPLLLALRARQVIDEHGSFHPDRLCPPLQHPVSTLVQAKGWTRADGTPTPQGRFFAERAQVMATTASYRPMLAAMPDLLFGDPRPVFDRDAEGHESHVDRSLNVIGSGFQHERFFSDLDATIVGIFDNADLDAQPDWVADMGCGDGSLLVRIWKVIRDRTRRGKLLDRHPLTMIGLDANARALEATAATLVAAGVPHLVAVGNIGDPEAALTVLGKLGVSDPAKVLHVRSFLDHDRPFCPPLEIAEAAERRNHRLGGVYVDQDGGLIEPADAVQSLVEHLRRWGRIAAGHGLLLLEVHSLPAKIVARYRDLSENLHFDAYHALSRQYLVDGNVFLLALAEAGLFPRRGQFMRYPRSLPFTRITAGWYEHRPYRVRHPRRADLPDLLALEAACWSAPLRLPAAALEARIADHPEQHLVLELDGHIVGAVYTQRIASIDALRAVRFADLAPLAVADGPVVQLLGMSVLPQLQDRGLGDELLDFVLRYCSVCSGVETVAGITRCRDWHLHRPMPLADYLGRIGADGFVSDPVPRFHQAHGARILGVVENYRPDDTDNDGAGVLIGYDLHGQDQAGSGPSVAGESSGDPAAIIESSVRHLLGPRGADTYAPDRSLRDIGLNSLDLMELRLLLGRRFGRDIGTSFFFTHPTPAAIAVQLTAPASPADMPRPPRSIAVETTADAAQSVDHGAIAVVGMACRFPGGIGDLDTFWRVLRDGVDCITQVPSRRWDADALTAAEPATPGRINSRYGGFLTDVDRFDAAFFGIGRREAMLLDPQQRLLLETSWEALEHAGLDARRLAGGYIGVYVGLISHDYEILQLRSRALREHGIYFCTGNAGSVAAGRLSYFYDFRGPAVVVDTACSSSLVSVHLACQALRTGEVDLAIAGGVHLVLAPELSVAYSQVRMLAPDGRCKTFDAAADGYGRGEGCGIVVLKPLARARANGDPILAVIRGSAVNQDGASNGLTAPNGAAQAAVIRRALDAAATSPEEVGFIECHGTGTALGDPIEVAALADVFGGRSKPLALGAVKTNIGHTEGAAGIAGLIKTILSVKNGIIPPNLHFSELNPAIDLEAMNANVPTAAIDWPDGARVAGVSSFGLSGTNAHVIVSDAPPEPSSSDEPDQRPCEAYPLSAATPAALSALAKLHADALTRGAFAFPDIAHTARVGRAALRHRLGMIATHAAEAAALLRATVAGETPDGVWRGEAPAAPPKVAFLFPGQGCQYAGMTRTLYETEQVFADIVDRCDVALAGRRSRRLIDALFGPDDGALDRTEWTQPALYAIEAGLAALWRSWGVEPSAVAGHSVGDYAAAWVAGVFDLEDGIRLIGDRAALMQALPAGGEMVAVTAPAETITAAVDLVTGPVAIAAWNGAEQAVLSGSAAAVAAALARLPDARTVRLPVSHAFHSPLMDPVMTPFGRSVASVALRPPVLPLVSGYNGAPSGDAAAEPDWWVRHLREPVRFADALAALDRLGSTVWIEVGPARVLTRLAQQNESRARVVASLVPGRDDRRCLQEALAQVYVAGAPVDWTAVDRGYRRRKVPLPTYPFQRESYWLAPGSDAVRAETGHPLLGRRLELAIADTVYEARLAGRSLGWLRGPGAALGLLDLALAAARRRWPGRAVTLAALRMLAPTPPGEDVVLQSAIDRHDRLTVSARAGGDSWTVLATASLAKADALPGGASRPGFELPRIDAKAGFVLHPDRLSACLRRASEAVGGMPLGVAEATVASEGEPMHAAIELEAGAVALTLTDIDGRSIAVLRTSPVAVSEVPALAAQP